MNCRSAELSGRTPTAPNTVMPRSADGLVLATSTVMPSLLRSVCSPLNISPNTPIDPVNVTGEAMMASAGHEM